MRQGKLKRLLAQAGIDRAQAKATNTSLAGGTLQQDGGAQHGRISVDGKGSTFGVYDAAFIASVSSKWYDLMNSYQDKGGVLRQGKVVLAFKLRFDGRIINMKTAERSVEEALSLMCERAVLDPAPFQPWPADMRRAVGHDERELQFSFTYE